jgi:hypothetical protein
MMIFAKIGEVGRRCFPGRAQMPGRQSRLAVLACPNTPSGVTQMEKLFSKALKQPPASEAPAAQSRVRRGRYPRTVSPGAQ